MSKDDTSNDRTGQPPRLLSWRSLFVAFVLGLGLAVLSVPVSALLNPPYFRSFQRLMADESFYMLDGDSIVNIQYFEGAGGIVWHAQTIVSDSTVLGHILAGPGVRITPETDPRPGRARMSSTETDSITFYVEQGFPIPCAWYRRWIPLVPNASASESGILRIRVRGDVRYLPSRPVPWGLAINTIFYGLPVLGLVVALRQATRARRRRKDRCVACNYDLSGIAGPCPECGCVDVGRVGHARTGVGGP